jgi:sugar phosphate isomerase/epimerase
MSQIALQLYTLRDFLKTPTDIAKTLKRVKHLGYAAVQASGLGPIPPAELKKILDGEGLACVATHINIDDLRKDPAQIIANHKALACKYTAIGGFGWADPTAPEWHAFAKEYTALAAKLQSAGLSLGYHNHSHEFIRQQGELPLEILLNECGKEVWFEIDTYWIQHGGGDPAAWIDSVAGRIHVVHFKDMIVQRADGKVSPVMAEVGAGNLNWPNIITSCRNAGVEWYCIEQDHCQRDPFESVAISLKNLQALGVA